MVNTYWANIAEKAEDIFMRPRLLHSWNDIIQGVQVCKSDGSTERMFAVAKNTWRAHHRKDRSQPGSSAIYSEFFIKHRDDILHDLLAVKDNDGVNALADKLAKAVRPSLVNLKPHVLGSYNSIRKPIDLYLEHLVAMAAEAPQDARARLTPMLSLPLDSQMLGAFEIGNRQFRIFSNEELKRVGLKPHPSYGHIKTETAYLRLQDIAQRQACNISASCGRPFYPIYFELLWNRRYTREGRNLFELNY